MILFCQAIIDWQCEELRAHQLSVEYAVMKYTHSVSHWNGYSSSQEPCVGHVATGVFSWYFECVQSSCTWCSVKKNDLTNSILYLLIKNRPVGGVS